MKLNIVSVILYLLVNVSNSLASDDFIKDVTGLSFVRPESVVNYIANGLSPNLIRPECDLRNFDESLSQSNGSAEQDKQFVSTIYDYINRCGENLSSGTSKGLLTLAKFAGSQYEVLSNSHIVKTIITQKSGVRSPAFIAVKDNKVRPWVILKCGVFCEADATSSVINYIELLFDETEFNLIVLGNRTGLDFVQENHMLSLGGRAEGLDAIEVAQWLKKSDYAQTVASVHYLAMSLGGSSAMFASLYNEKVKALDSITAICPVINLEDSMKLLYSAGSGVGQVAYNKTKNQLVNGKPYLQDVADQIQEDKMPDRASIADFVASLVGLSEVRRGVSDPSTNAEKFWSQNDFFQYNPRITTPVLVMASEDDPIVNNSANTARLLKDKMLDVNPSMHVVNLPYGSHCATNMVYGDGFTNAVFKNFILNHSQAFKKRLVLKTKNLDLSDIKISTGEQHVEQEWKFNLNSNQANVTFKIFSPDNSSFCFSKDPWAGSSYCYREMNKSISLTDLPGVNTPTTNAEAEALSRYFNTQVHFNFSEKKIRAGEFAPYQILWRSL